MRQRAGTVPFDDQGLEGFTAWIWMLGQVVRKLDGYLHNRIVRLADEPRKYLLTTPSLLWYITPVKKCASPSARLPLQFKSNFSGGFHVHEPLRWPFYGHTRKRPFYGHTRKRPLCSHT